MHDEKISLNWKIKACYVDDPVKRTADSDNKSLAEIKQRSKW